MRWVTFGAIFWEDCESQWLTVKMPRNGRRKRSLSSGEDSLVSYYSKHRCIDREYSPVTDSRHYKRGSSSIRSRELRHNRHSSRNRSRSTRRSDRRLKRQKFRNDPSEISTVRILICSLFNNEMIWEPENVFTTLVWQWTPKTSTKLNLDFRLKFNGNLSF